MGGYKVTTYGYDGLNRRVFQASEGKVEVSYLYDGLEVLQEVGGSENERIMTYFRANSQIVSRQERQLGGSVDATGWMTVPGQGPQQFYIHDGLGSVVAMSSANGTVTDRYKYDAFGEFTKTLNSEKDPNDVFNNAYTFTGRRFDTASGLLYTFHFRQYDPTTGVWTTPDPIGILGGINLYAYVDNNPVNWVDFLGLHLGDYAGGPGNDGIGNSPGESSGGGSVSLDRAKYDLIDPEMGLNVNDFNLGVDLGPDGLGSDGSGTGGYGFGDFLADLAAQMGLASALSVETGPPSLVCGAIAALALGLRAGFYSEHPYRDTVQNAVLTSFGTGKVLGDLILGEVIDQFNEYSDQSETCENK